MKHAKKLDLKLEAPLRHCHQKVMTFGLVEEKSRVVSKYIPVKTKELIKSQLPKLVADHVMYVVFSEIEVIGPHVHTLEKCVMNWYLTTGEENTTFYEGEYEQDDRYVKDNGNNYYAVNMDKIYPVEHFTAKAGDVWLLNTHIAHSVSLPNRDHKENSWSEKVYHESHLKYSPAGISRTAIQILIDLPFEKTAACFKEG